MNVKINAKNQVTITGLTFNPQPSTALRTKGKGNMLLVSEHGKIDVVLPDGRTVQAQMGLNLHCKPHLLEAQSGSAPELPQAAPEIPQLDFSDPRVQAALAQFRGGQDQDQGTVMVTADGLTKVKASPKGLK